jgi:integrase
MKSVNYMKKLNSNDINLLNHAFSSGIIDLAYVLEQSANLKRSRILKKHKTEYWQSQGDTYNGWFWRNPCKETNPNRTLIKRKRQEDIEKVIVDHYLKLEQKLLQQLSRDNMTFEELFYEFIEDKKTKRASGTIKRNTSDWKKFIKPHTWFTEMSFKSIKKLDVDKLFNSIIKEHHVNDKAFGNIVGLVKQAYQYAIEADYIDKSPYRINVNKELVEAFQKKDSKLEVFQPHERELLITEQERRLLNNPSNTANLAIILCFELGARKGEILALRDSDIDYEKRVLTISRQFVDNDVIDDIENIKRIGYKVTNRTKGRTGKSRKVAST